MSSEVRVLLNKGFTLPYGHERVQAHSEAVRVADQQRDEDSAYIARNALVTSAVMGGQPDVGLMAFAWVIAKHTADPDRFKSGGANGVLWQYKWVIEHLSELPNVSRPKIAELIADLDDRSTASGLGKRSTKKLRLWSALNMFDTEQFEPLSSDWLHERRDALSDCQACDLDCEASTYIARGDLETATKVASPLFGGKLRCAEVPTITYGAFLVPCLQAGRSDTARQFAAVLAQRIAGNPVFVMGAGALVYYMSLVDLDSALKLAGRYAPWALSGESPLHRLPLITGIAIACRRATEQGLGARTLDTAAAAIAGLPLSAVAARFEDEARNNAKAFDDRNGHDRVSRRVNGNLQGDSVWGWPL